PGTWETLPSPSKGRLEPRLTNSRWIHSLRPGLIRANKGTTRWYRQTKATKCGEMGGRESQRLIVLLSRGTSPRDAREGRRQRLVDRGRETRPVPRGQTECHRNDHGSPGERRHGMKSRMRQLRESGFVVNGADHLSILILGADVPAAPDAESVVQKAG